MASSNDGNKDVVNANDNTNNTVVNDNQIDDNTNQDNVDNANAQNNTNDNITDNKNIDDNNDNNNNNDNDNSDTKNNDVDEKKYDPNNNNKSNKNQIPQNLEPKPPGKKNKIVIGSFDSNTFHYSFKNQKDPLDIGMFPVYSYLKIPHVGVYGNSYEPTQLRALLELSMNNELISKLPNKISSTINNIMNKDINKDKNICSVFDGYVIIHHCPKYQQTQHFNMNCDNLFNIMYHCWNYCNINNLSNDQQIEDILYMGLFEALNVFEIRNDNKVKSIVDRGIKFGEIEQRSCFLHGFGFSPCNADIARDTQAGYCSFYMIGCTKDYKRAVLSYHIFANNNDMDDILKWTFKEIKTVKQLLTAFTSLQWGNIAQNLEILCKHY